MLTKQLREKADKLLGSLSKNNVSRFVMVAVGPDYVESGNTACHGGLSSFTPAGHREGVVTAAFQNINSQGLLVKDTKKRVAYLDYLLNRSPWATAYVDKDAEKCVAEDSIEITAHVPSNLMAGACVATRSMWERHGALAYTFAGLSSAGVEEDVAMLLANLITAYPGSSDDRGIKIKWCRPQEDHHPVCPLAFDWESLANFLNHKPSSPNSTWVVSPYYRGLNKLFISTALQHTYEGNVRKPFSQFIVDFYGKEVVAKSVYNNPFPKPASQVAASSIPMEYEPIDLAIAKMAGFYHKILKQKIAEECKQWLE